ncbi:hypothetical protein BJ322DRAFT_1162004 [Thelephora terrestris]|uniref:Uncharacterized protein n=1 Tax=Thelephora terrestris TaxID=56493 RepID=A0A9P6L3N9_9AGAM|nr:hypothetical protein BJ322DRAFT_1162004 [Thelephora terrestris]
MSSKSRPSKKLDGVLPKTDAAIQLPTIAKDVCGVALAQIASGSARVLLAMILEPLGNKQDFIDLGLVGDKKYNKVNSLILSEHFLPGELLSAGAEGTVFERKDLVEKGPRNPLKISRTHFSHWRRRDPGKLWQSPSASHGDPAYISTPQPPEAVPSVYFRPIPLCLGPLEVGTCVGQRHALSPSSRSYVTAVCRCIKVKARTIAALGIISIAAPEHDLPTPTASITGASGYRHLPGGF